MRGVLARMYVTGRNFVHTDDDADRGFFCPPSSSCVLFCGWPPAVPVFFSVVFPKSLWACGVALGGGCGRQETSRLHPRVSYVDMDLAARI